MLPTVLVALPALGALALLAVPARAARARRATVLGPWLALTVAEVGLAIALWAARPGGAGAWGEVAVRWIPALGVGYHVGVDGLSLPLVVMTTLLFAAVAVHGASIAGPRERLRAWVALMLALESTCLGVFVALDLVLFFVFFDASIALMYFVISGWGGRGSARSALLFFLYTFVGSLVMLLGFLGLAVSGRGPVTFDIPALSAADPIAGRGLAGALVLVAILVGLAIKIPTVPFHTWLPPAHTDAPSAGSAILAGVLLKMGTYGLVRIAMPLLPDAWRSAALVIVAVGAASVLWGALLALAQRDLKRMIAYTSVNHMGYVVLAVGAAGVVAAGPEARTLAVTGATTQMVSHGLITGALFLLAGTLRDRGDSSEIDAWSGLAGPMPRWAVLVTVAALASLGLPGFSGFVAEFPILAGALPAGGAVTVLTAVSALGIAITAGLFLRALQRLLLGEVRAPTRTAGTGASARAGASAGAGSPGRPLAALRDLRPVEVLAVAPLLLASVLVGVWPSVVTSVIEPSARLLVTLVSR